ncbi:hypothetical protein HHI36_005211 [Cryptolaemus montrouzieri]|uniref:Uncharacterized protein n=1 Tax=Cryptolaemus montrouzieri TaxID=559131 RepID=A0ABD2NTV9_9CUCU
MKALILFVFFGLSYANPLYPYERTAVFPFKVEGFKNVSFQLKSDQMRELQKSLIGSDVLIANINEFMDKFIQNTDALFKRKNMDPMPMPEVYEEMSADILWLIPYKGFIDMYYGSLTGPSTIYRKGDSIVSYDKDTEYLRLKVPISFKTLQFSYIFTVSFPLIFTSHGRADGGVTDLDMNIAIGVNFVTGLISLDEYTITNSGHISISFHTTGLLPNWTWNLMLNACTALLNGYILEILQSVVEGTLTSAINVLNTIIQNILNA